MNFVSRDRMNPLAGLKMPFYVGMLYSGVFHDWFSLPKKGCQLVGFYRKGKHASARDTQKPFA